MSEKECLKELENSRFLTVSVINQDGQTEFSCDFEQTAVFNTFKQLIEEHFKDPDQTLDFKHFKLCSDNTLKNMNKEELVSYIHMLYRNWTSCDKTCQNLINHAKKLSDSNDELRKQLYFCEPYRFEDLYEGMWVWDDKWEEAKNIRKIQLQDCFNKRWICFTEGRWLEFEEGRFFPATKAMQYQEEIKEMKLKGL
ncbi:hypothetical protein SD457_06685 [Coprobacillaceae bacterium CR2/5/TPMF4]|nr:hypothetical protein SD457_06685 [Coprobacillaceae bacterium CR2/5/TPMF4]